VFVVLGARAPQLTVVTGFVNPASQAALRYDTEPSFGIIRVVKTPYALRIRHSKLTAEIATPIFLDFSILAFHLLPFLEVV
jgi:hypothetical protein